MKLNRFLFSLLVIFILLIATSACENGGDDDNDDDDEDDDDDDDDNGSDDCFDDSDKLLARISVSSSQSGQIAYAYRNNQWHEEKIEADPGLLGFSRSHPDFARILHLSESPDTILHFDGDTWLPETIKGDYSSTWFMGFHEDLGLAIGCVMEGEYYYYENCRDILARDENGVWSAETLPEIGYEYDFIGDPLFDKDGNAFVIGYTFDPGENDFLLRRDATGWAVEELPFISNNWSLFGSRKYSAPDGRIWIEGGDYENTEAFLLRQGENEWIKEELPETNDLAWIYDLAFCPDGTVFAVGADENFDAGVILKKDGTWSQETIDVDYDDWSFQHAYCSSANEAFVIGYINFGWDEDGIGFVVSNRTGDWVEENLPIPETENNFLRGPVSFKDGSLFFWGGILDEDDNNEPFILSLAADTWTKHDLSAWTSKNSHVFIGFGGEYEGIVADSNGNLWAGLMTSGIDYVLKYCGGAWVDKSPDISPFFGVDLIAY